ncbi:MAG: chemotaxis protein CheD [Magnetococcales bacterium]|nr:chemotaxis protein CheD [Magnetococcales bacterium]MBF0272250.1 chemotaxis protein CheD [Magnetococcales bacterium]
MTTGGDPSKPFLMPGALFAQNGAYVITTVLGSCIAVCLWDRMRKEGGMNHYKLPLWNGDGLPSPKYGNIAIAKLIERMDEMGCLRRNIVAKVFGGGAVIKSTSGLLNVGERNIEVAVDLLARENIPIIASDMGGDYSRKIIFDTESGAIMMKKASPS